MSKRKPRPGPHWVRVPPAPPQKTAKTGPKQTRRWRQPLAWSGGIATVVLAGVLVNVLSPQASRIIPPPPSTPGNVTGSEAPSKPAATASAASAQPTASASTRPSTDPLTVVSEDPVATNPSFYSWVLPRPLVLSSAALKSLLDSSSPNAFPNYMFSIGGYQLGGTETQLVVQNNQNVPLRVINMDVIKSCAAPLDGTLFYLPAQGSDPGVKIDFDLNSAYSIATGPPAYNSTTPYFANYTVSIAPGAQQVFDLFTRVFNLACTFRYRLTILEGEAKVYQIIGDGSGPFRASGGFSNGFFSGFKVMYILDFCNPFDVRRQLVRVNPKTWKSC